MTILYRPLEADEVDSYLDVMELAFGIDLPPAQRARSKKVVDISRMRTAVDNGKIVATFNGFQIELTVPGNMVPMSGVSQVTVAPTHRRRGILTNLMREHFVEARERGELLAGLWASESHIYGRYGYGIAAHRYVTKLAKPYAVMSHPGDATTRIEMITQPEALEILPSIYDTARPQTPGMLSRTKAWWETRILADPPENRQGATAYRHAILKRGDENIGYAIYYHRLPNGYGSLELHIVELVGLDGEAELSLWNYLLSLDLTVSISCWNHPIDSAVLMRTVEQRRWERTLLDTLWLRLVDNVGALSSRQYSSAGEIVFDVEDEYCPWNAGRFLLSVDDKGVGVCEKTERAAQLSLSARELGTLYLGGSSAWQMWRSGLIQGSEGDAIWADRMFRWHRLPWCPHIF